MRFDHLLNWVPDREAAVAAIREAGFHAVIGGEHPAWGTHNALIHFGLPYMEIIAVQKPEQARFAPEYNSRERERLIGRGGGSLTFVVAVPDLTAAIAELRARGLDVEEPESGHRVRPDGSVVRWRTAALRSGPRWRPFLIEWEQSDPERLADLQARGIDAPHPNGAQQLDRILIATNDPSGDAAWGARLTGIPALRDGEAYVVPLPECQLVFQHAAMREEAPMIATLVIKGGAASRRVVNGLEIIIEV